MGPTGITNRTNWVSIVLESFGLESNYQEGVVYDEIHWEGGSENMSKSLDVHTTL